VSTSLTGSGSQVSRCAVPDAYTFADDARGLSRPRLRRLRPRWSRPVHIDVCSMFARTPRYTPAAPGIRSATPMSAGGLNGSSQHVLALSDSSSRRINEQNSGLLIRGFGVRVPGGAPVLTWGFIAPGHFHVTGLFPCSLHVCSRARTQLPVAFTTAELAGRGRCSWPGAAVSADAGRVLLSPTRSSVAWCPGPADVRLRMGCAEFRGLWLSVGRGG